jgi:hypothetical protein
MVLDLRSLWAWCREVVGRGGSTAGPLGIPSIDLDEAPPGIDQDANRAVSGGGMVGPDDQAASSKARRSR